MVVGVTDRTRTGLDQSHNLAPRQLRPRSQSSRRESNRAASRVSGGSSAVELRDGISPVGGGEGWLFSPARSRTWSSRVTAGRAAWCTSGDRAKRTCPWQGSNLLPRTRRLRGDCSGPVDLATRRECRIRTRDAGGLTAAVGVVALVEVPGVEPGPSPYQGAAQTAMLHLVCSRSRTRTWAERNQSPPCCRSTPTGIVVPLPGFEPGLDAFWARCLCRWATGARSPPTWWWHWCWSPPGRQPRRHETAGADRASKLSAPL